MWSRCSLFLCVRVKIGGLIPRIYLSLFPVSSLFLSVDSAMSLLPSNWGARARRAVDTLHAFFLALMRLAPQPFAHIEVSEGTHNIYVDIKTAGPRLWWPKMPSGTARIYGDGFVARLISCIAGMCAAAACFGLSYPKAVVCGMIATIIYTFIRPLVSALILGLDMLLFGLASILSDGLLITWAAAWTRGMELGYYESVAAAVLVGIIFAPYAYKRRAGIV